jgi:hypothetical protein
MRQLASVFLVLTSLSSSAAAFDWESIPAGEWVDVPTTGESAPKVFHGGAAIAPERGEVYFFGSDTHHPTELEKGESNSVWRLDLQTLCWSRDYEQDSKSAYRITPDSQAVTTTGRPWAMHTFDCVEWDPSVERMVVVSHPVHARFAPDERFPVFAGRPDWFKSLRSSHWEYDPDTKRWRRYDFNPPALFARAMTRDPARNELVATDGEATWVFDRAASRWSRIDEGTVPGWHLSMVFDTAKDEALLLGRNTGSDTLYAWRPERRNWRTVDMQGSTMPANGAAIAYDTNNEVMLYLANDYHNQYNNPTGKAVTFLYHSAERRWERLDIESPELYGMNYLMQYDPVRNVVLHFEKSPAVTGDGIRVWAFRYRRQSTDNSR